jgi:hypothetical protein
VVINAYHDFEKERKNLDSKSVHYVMSVFSFNIHPSHPSHPLKFSFHTKEIP